MEPAIHVVVPDTQAKPGVPTEHLDWIGRFLVDEFSGHPNLKWIHLGDHADMPSLSSYDKGRKSMEGRRYVQDIEAANHAFEVLNAPLVEYNARKAQSKHAQWWPARHITLGNHEDRINRAVESDAQVEGLLSTDDLNYSALGWQVHEYLDPTFIDGVAYAHFFSNPMSGRPLGGVASTRLKNVGYSFTMGHQQVLDYAVRWVRSDVGEPRSQHALIAGACYLHDEAYKGFQGNDHWRGIIVKFNVHDGSYDPWFISLDYLRRRFSS